MYNIRTRVVVPTKYHMIVRRELRNYTSKSFSAQCFLPTDYSENSAAPVYRRFDNTHSANKRINVYYTIILQYLKMHFQENTLIDNGANKFLKSF